MGKYFVFYFVTKFKPIFGYICGYIYGQILDYFWDQTFRIILDQFQLNFRPNFWETFPKNSCLIFFLTTSVHDRSLNPIGKISSQICDTILTIFLDQCLGQILSQILHQLNQISGKLLN